VVEQVTKEVFWRPCEEKINDEEVLLVASWEEEVVMRKLLT
jgi:hypothetical protein